MPSGLLDDLVADVGDGFPDSANAAVVVQYLHCTDFDSLGNRPARCGRIPLQNSKHVPGQRGTLFLIQQVLGQQELDKLLWRSLD